MTPWYCLGPDVKPGCSNNKSVIGRRELSTLVDPAALQEPPTNTNEKVIDLLDNTYASITIPGRMASLRSLIPGTRNSQPYQEERAVHNNVMDFHGCAII